MNLAVVQKLDVLLWEEPDPTEEVAAIWADTLGEGTTAQQILTYAFLKQADTKPKSPSQKDSPVSQVMVSIGIYVRARKRC